MSSAAETNVDQMLSKIGLTEALVHEVLQAGELARGSVSRLAPRPARGTTRYNVQVEQLRLRMLRTPGYEMGCFNGLEVVVNKAERLAIFFVQGDEDTGRTAGAPESIRRCGAMTHLAKDSNLRQLQFFFARRGEMEPPVGPDGLTFWAILFHRDGRGGEIRVEVSLPVGIDSESGRINAWAPRIILTPVKLLRPQRRRTRADGAALPAAQNTFRRRAS